MSGLYADLCDQQGVSYSLTTLALPALLVLPSADAAVRTFRSISSRARKQLQYLSALSGSAFALAFALSPRAYRHPYLLYTSLFVFGSGAATLDSVAPYIGLQTTKSASPVQQERKKARTARLEASYVELGAGSDAHSDGSSAADGDEIDSGSYNGEEVRAEVDGFRKKQLAQTVIAGVGFLMAVVGIWGDGATTQFFASETFIIEA
jgi:autophagy-related protein 33